MSRAPGQRLPHSPRCSEASFPPDPSSATPLGQAAPPPSLLLGGAWSTSPALASRRAISLQLPAGLQNLPRGWSRKRLLPSSCQLPRERCSQGMAAGRGEGNGCSEEGRGKEGERKGRKGERGATRDSKTILGIIIWYYLTTGIASAGFYQGWYVLNRSKYTSRTSPEHH